jgi:hypothetical protein
MSWQPTRSFMEGMGTRGAVDRFLADRRLPGTSSRSVIGAIRRKLVKIARAHHRNDLIDLFIASPRSRRARSAAIAIEPPLACTSAKRDAARKMRCAYACAESLGMFQTGPSSEVGAAVLTATQRAAPKIVSTSSN